MTTGNPNESGEDKGGGNRGQYANGEGEAAEAGQQTCQCEGRGDIANSAHLKKRTARDKQGRATESLGMLTNLWRVCVQTR